MITRNDVVYERIAKAMNSLQETDRVGILIRGYFDVSPYHIAEKLFRNGFTNLKLAAIGYPLEDIECDIETTTHIEKAVEWRSQPDSAGNIVVFVKEDVAKMHSLIDFNELGARDFTLQLIDWAQNNMTRSEQLNKFWDILRDDSSSFPFLMIENFVNAVYQDSNTQDVISNNLWRLGLLRDTKLFNNNMVMSNRVQRNRELLIKMGQLSEESRKRINSAISKASGANKTVLLETYRNLQEFYKRGGIEPLKKLEFDAVSDLLVSSNKPSTRTVVVTGDGDGYEGILKSKDLNNSISECFVNNDPDSKATLKHLAEHIIDSFSDEQDDKIEEYTDDVVFDGQTINFDQPDKELRKFIGKACNVDSWGSILKTNAEHIKDAIIKATQEDMKAFNPRDPSCWYRERSFFEVFESMDNQTGRPFSDILSDLKNSRNKLIEYIDIIMLYPLVLFGGVEDARNALIKYIEIYSELFRSFKEIRLYNHDSIVIRSIAEGLLKLEVVLIETPNEWKAIITPLHPFHLWRYYEVVNAINDNNVLTEHEQKQLSEALTQMPHLLHYVINTALPEGNNNQPVLPQSGFIGLLPTYENKTNRFLGSDGVEFIKDLLNRWIAFAPYTKSEIRLGLVDTPDIPLSVKMVVKFLQENKFANKVLIDAYFTRGQNVTGDLSDFNYEDDDHEINDYIRKGKLVINWWHKDNIEEVNDSIIERPVHIVYFFDQSQYSIGHGPSIKQLFVSPLVITYDYEYSTHYQRGTISPSSKAESGLFGDYHDLVSIAAPMPAGQTIRMTFSQGLEVGPVDTIIDRKGAIWLAIADRVITPYAPTSVIPLGEIKNGQREIGVWASAESKVVEQYVNLLRKYDLNVNEEILLHTINNFGHIASGGIITIPKYGGSPEDLERKRKGLLGTIITAAWYKNKYPDSLIASLDTKLARLWLSRRKDGGERADLIGLRIENDKYIIEPIEVKSYKDNDPVVEVVDASSMIKKLDGKPVDQIESMLKILEQIFMHNQGDKLLTHSRREILKYQLHTECFRVLHDPDWRSNWYQKLKRLFSEEPSLEADVEIKGIISQVVFEENGRVALRQYDEQNLSFIKIQRGEINRLLNEDNSGNEQDIVEEEASVISEETMSVNNEQYDGTDESTEPTISHRNSVDEEYSYNIEDVSQEELEEIARSFMRASEAYQIRVDECCPSRVSVGPGVIRFRVKLSRGQSLNPLKDKLVDIEREMSRSNLLVSPIPNSNEIALDIPRVNRPIIPLLPALELMPLISSIEELPFPLGVSPEGENIVARLDEMPHLLIGGSTGSGKTILLYSILTALIKTHPNAADLRLFISSSGLEDFVYFENLPHLGDNRVITDAVESVELIENLIFDEFEKRSEILTEARCPNVMEYNRNNVEKISPLVVVVDEFADLTDCLSTPRKTQFYDTIRRIVQIGRKRSVHLVLCTQRPSADLVPTNIRSGINGRIGLRVNDAPSSKMILDMYGAQNLQKKGDLLFKDGDIIKRAQGYFISTEELEEFLANYL